MVQERCGEAGPYHDCPPPWFFASWRGGRTRNASWVGSRRAAHCRRSPVEVACLGEGIAQVELCHGVVERAGPPPRGGFALSGSACRGGQGSRPGGGRFDPVRFSGDLRRFISGDRVAEHPARAARTSARPYAAAAFQAVIRSAAWGSRPRPQRTTLPSGGAWPAC